MADNLSLYVASYGDDAAAKADYQALKDAESAEDFSVVGAVVASRDADGKVSVEEHGAASPVAGGTVLGAAGGLALGLFAPPLLLATALGAGIGGGIGALSKKHQEKKLGVDLEEYLPAGSSAVVVVVDDTYLDRVDNALAKSSKKISKAVDAGDVDKLQKEIADADKRISNAAAS